MRKRQNRALVATFAALLIAIAAKASSSALEAHAFDKQDEEYDETLDKTVIYGTTVINDIAFDAVCKCSQIPDSISTDEAFCSPNKLKLVQDRDGAGASMDQVRTFVGDVEKLRFVDPEKTSFRCMDGREPGDVMATPGGDAGEFILALYVYESMTRDLNQEAVDSFLTEYLKTLAAPPSEEQDAAGTSGGTHRADYVGFYMCTDDAALAHLENQLGMSLNVEILRKPPAPDQRDLLRALVQPENQGDRHIKNLIKNPSLYSIRAELVQMFVVAFYKILWNEDAPQLAAKLRLESLVGVPQEQAFLEVRSNEICAEMDLIPLVPAKRRLEDSEGEYTLQIFVNHIDAAAQTRRRLAHFFADQVSKRQAPIDAETMYNRMNKHGLSFLEVSGSRMARSLPFYSLNLM